MTQQREAQQAPSAEPARRRLGGGTIALAIGLAFLATFIIQNRQDVKLDFLWWSFTWPLWIYTIVCALFGALVWFGVGVMRRRRRRKERRENRQD